MVPDDQDLKKRGEEAATDAAADPSASALQAAAPELLHSIEERRKRELIRMRLFGEAQEPVRIGRFVPLRRLGAGGMGVVYVAYDEHLHREVALKLLRSHGERARARLLREAQTLAKVTHPNIVSIYEVGVADERVFIAMECISGKTLREWLAAKPRRWREVVAIFLQAGQGLLAVHQQGLIHRDFKPENVMVGDDGRVHIVDFGLARWVEPEANDPGLSLSGDERSPVAALARSSTGGIGGTPLYMPPEQYHRQGDLDARSDQFAFCVALFEGLYGTRPFTGATHLEIIANMATGVARKIPNHASVPEWLEQVVLRGLREAPDERWSSMEELLAELGKDRWKWRRHALFAAGLVVLVSASMAMGHWLRLFAHDSCTEGRPRIEEVWGHAQHDAMRQAILHSGALRATEIWPRVQRILDQYANAWAQMYTEACLAHARHEQSDELFDLRMSCLDERRSALRATAQVLRETGGRAEAVEVAGGVESLKGCADVVELRASVKLPADPAAKHEVARLRERLSRVEAEEHAGHYDQALAEANRALDDGKTLGYEPVIAEALFFRGSQESRLGRYEDAVGTLEQAFAHALACRHDELAGRTACMLLYVRGYRQGKLEAASPWESVAEGIVRRQGSVGKLAVDFFSNRGLFRMLQGAHEQALDDFQRVLPLTEAVYGLHHLKFARVLSNISQSLMVHRKYAAARVHLERALSIREENLGKDHPVVAGTLASLATTLNNLGEFDAAEAAGRRALAINQRALAPGHPDTATGLRVLGESLMRQGRFDEAAEHLLRAQESLERTQPRVQLRLAAVLVTLAQLAERRQQGPKSAAYAEQAVRSFSEVLRADHVELGYGLAVLGDALMKSSRSQEAAEPYRRALAILESKLGSQHAAVGAPLVGLAHLALQKRDTAHACALLDRAVAVFAHERPSAESGAARFTLARMLELCRPTPEQNYRRALAEQAYKDFEAAGPAYRREAAEVAAWLGQTK